MCSAMKHNSILHVARNCGKKLLRFGKENYTYVVYLNKKSICWKNIFTMLEAVWDGRFEDNSSLSNSIPALIFLTFCQLSTCAWTTDEKRSNIPGVFDVMYIFLVKNYHQDESKCPVLHEIIYTGSLELNYHPHNTATNIVNSN